MFGKLLLIILAAGVMAASLLVIRQHRFDTAHRISRTHQQMNEHERALWKMQSEIARRCSPDEIRTMIERLPDQWKPIPDPTMLAPAPGNGDGLEIGATDGFGAAADRETIPYTPAAPGSGLEGPAPAPEDDRRLGG